MIIDAHAHLWAESRRMALETAGISDETRRLLAYGNAARLFGLVSPPLPIPPIP